MPFVVEEIINQHKEEELAVIKIELSLCKIPTEKQKTAKKFAFSAAEHSESHTIKTISISSPS